MNSQNTWTSEMSDSETVVLIDETYELLSDENRPSDDDSSCCENKEKVITQCLILGTGFSIGLGGVVYLLLHKEPMLALLPAALILFSLVVAGIIEYCARKEEAREEELTPLMLRPFA